MQTSRRLLVKTGLVTGAVATLTAPTLDLRATAAAAAPRTDPFTLGVASGDPTSDGVVLWTRLAVDPLADDGLGGMASRSYDVGWQVATDERFRQRRPAGHGARHGRRRALGARRGGRAEAGPRVLLPVPARAPRLPRRAHPHGSGVRRAGSRPSRCRSSRARSSSTAGSRRTAGWPRTSPTWCCTSATTSTSTRRTPTSPPPATCVTTAGPETVTLANYRQRHAQYSTDPDLQAAHAVAPWLVVFDDHEVDNNWADEIPENAASVAGFMDRRAAAFRAYYENMPLRRSSIPNGTGHPDLPPAPVGPAGELPHARHPAVPRRPGLRRRVQGLSRRGRRPARSLPGTTQEQWLAEGFASSRATWDVIGQQVFFGRRDSTTTPDEDRLDGRLGRLPRLAGPGDRVVGRRAGPQPDRADRRRARALGLGGARPTSTRRTPPWSARSSSARRSPPPGTGTTSRPGSTRGRRTTRT